MHFHTETTLFRSDVGIVSDFHCWHPRDTRGFEFEPSAHAIALVRRGTFERRVGCDATLADPIHILFNNTRQPQRIVHPRAGGDASTIVMPSPSLLDDVGLGSEMPFRAAQTPASLRVMRVHADLITAVRRNGPDVVIDACIVDLVSAAIESATARAAAAARSARLATRRRRRAIVETVRDVLNERLADPPSLSALAATAGCSPFHLSRVFREECGVPMRRYLAQLRAQAAAQALGEGRADLSALGFRLGFADHSHFTNVFRRVWGESPSAFRARFEQ